MYDRDLLILAAKGADIELPEFWTWGMSNRSARGYWDPLMDDGDAFRLAVKTGVLQGRGFENAWSAMYAVNLLPKNEYEATRRAIVLAAAQLGKSK